MRDTFLKLLRPGLNYKKVFESQCRKKWNKWEKDCEEKNQDFDTYVKKQMNSDETLSKEEALDKMELTDRDMKSVMKALGLKLEGEVSTSGGPFFSVVFALLFANAFHDRLALTSLFRS